MKQVSLTAAAIIAVGFLSGISSAGTPDLASCDSWMPACTSNYTNSSRPSSYPINYVVIHKVQGSASGAASWFQNCSSGVSAHYTFNNTSGYCYQSVLESDIAWHAGSWTYNTQSVGIEHGGYVTNNDTSDECYRESGLETRSTIIYYNVLWNRGRVVGHSEVPGASHTDPGVHWNWNYYMSCSNPLAGGGIRKCWLDTGGAAGPLGNPTTPELIAGDGIGRYNQFDGSGGRASIFYTPSTGAHEVHGGIHTKWASLGWEYGVCGYPTTNESITPSGVGRYNHFSKRSSIYWSPSTGAHQVGGSIRDKWISLGWEGSALGYPTSDEYAISGGRRSNFQGGYIIWNSSTSVVTVYYT